MNKIWLIILSIIFNLFTILSQSSGDRINNDICFSSEDNNYILKSEKDQCLLNNCEEYPEISPGCIICEDKLNEYKKNNKCQMCKYRYFKTKEEKCIYCASEKYGGPACKKCGYDKDTDNII